MQVRQQLVAVKADCLLANTLDEVAWLFNLRGSDVPYNPGLCDLCGLWREGHLEILSVWGWPCIGAVQLCLRAFKRHLPRLQSADGQQMPHALCSICCWTGWFALLLHHHQRGSSSDPTLPVCCCQRPLMLLPPCLCMCSVCVVRVGVCH